MANGNKEVCKIITVYRQTGCEAKGIRAVKDYIPFVMRGNSGQFNPLFYAAFKVQKQQSDMFIFLPSKTAFSFSAFHT